MRLLSLRNTAGVHFANRRMATNFGWARSFAPEKGTLDDNSRSVFLRAPQQRVRRFCLLNGFGPEIEQCEAYEHGWLDQCSCNDTASIENPVQPNRVWRIS